MAQLVTKYMNHGDVMGWIAIINTCYFFFSRIKEDMKIMLEEKGTRRYEKIWLKESYENKRYDNKKISKIEITSFEIKLTTLQNKQNF